MPSEAPPLAPGRAVLVARQPVCDERRAVVGYELVLGDGGGDARSTAQLVVDAFAGIGLDELVGARPAHLRVSGDFLLEVGAPPVRPDRVVLELDAEAAGDPRVLGVVRELALRGYAFALRAGGHPGAAPLPAEALAYVGIVALDAAAGTDAALARAAELRGQGVTVLARGIETHADFERFRAAGCRRFQGAFLERPRLVDGGRLATDRLGALSAAAQLQAGAMDMEELERLITRDVGLSYKLLRYVNSAFFGLAREVRGVGEAVVILGERAVRRWATVMSLAAGPETPEELVVLSLCRARMCERLGADTAGAAPDELFTVGLFSVVDALLDAPLEALLERLPFAEPIKQALLAHAGPLGETLARVLAWERGEFDAAAGADPPAELAVAYRQALAWATAAGEALR